MNSLPSTFVALLVSTVFTFGLQASDLSLANSQLDCSDGILQGWKMSNAAPITTAESDGRSAVLLPSEFPARFAKLWQRIPFDGNIYQSLKVVIEVRAVDRKDLSGIDLSMSKPRLRIFYFPADTRWTNEEILWPVKKEGSLMLIEPRDGWQSVSYELPTPENTCNVEIAVEADDAGFGIEVDEINISAVPRS